MHIALFTDCYVPMTSGVSTAVENLAEGLAKRGHKILIIAPHQKGHKDQRIRNISIVRIRGLPALFYQQFKLTGILNPKVISAMNKAKVQIVHIVTPFTLGLQGILLAKMLRLPLVGTFHTFIADPQYLKHLHLKGDLPVRIAWRYSNFYYNKCDIVTAPSEQTRKEILANRCKQQVSVISNGIDMKMFNNTNAPLLRKQYAQGGKILLFIGRIAHEKNILYLLDTFRHIVRAEPKTCLLIIGDGPQMSLVKSRLHRHGLTNNVFLLGRIEHGKLVKSGLFGAADVFVSASTTENQPMTVLEAQANGLPCVLINARGMKDLVVDGFNGYLVKNKDKKAYAQKCLRLIRDNTLRAEMRKHTEMMIAKHDLKKVLDKWETTYKELVSR